MSPVFIPDRQPRECDRCEATLTGDTYAESCTDCGESRCTSCMWPAMPKYPRPGLSHDYYICALCIIARVRDVEHYCAACGANAANVEDTRDEYPTAVCCG